MSASSTTAPGTSNAGSTTRRVTTKAFLGGFKSWRTPIGIKGLFKGSSGSNGGRIGGIGGIVGGGSILGGGGNAWAKGTADKGCCGGAAPAKGVRRPGKQRILMLISDTGGGHRASAMALKGAIEHMYGPSKYEITIVDIWSKHTPWPHNQFPKSYNTMVKYPILWRLTYGITAPKIVHVPQMRLIKQMIGGSVSRAFDEYDPDLIVSLHPLLQHVPIQVIEQRARAGLRKPAFATVVTDLTTCHPTWYHPRVDRLFVPTDVVRRAALRYGVPAERITMHGLPIRPAFSVNLPSKAKVRAALGMDRDTPAVLVVGGGEGMGPVEKQVRALAKEVGPRGQVVVICGRNEALVRRLGGIAWPEGMRVIVNGFVSNMHEWMLASDVIVTKAGPGTIAESMICGLPTILNGFIPCQEEGNVDFVTDNGVGVFEKNVTQVARLVDRWFADPAGLAAMSAKARALGAPQATFRIAEDVCALMKDRK